MARQKRTSRRRIYSPQHFQGSRDHHYLHHYPYHRLQIPIRMPTHNLPRQCCNKSRPRRTPNTRRNSAHCYYRICCFLRVVCRRGIVWGRVSPVIVTEQPHPTKKQEHCAHPQQERSYQHKSQRYNTHSNSSTLQCSTTIRRGPPIPPHQHPYQYHHDDDNERRVIDDRPCFRRILPPCYNRCSPPTLWVPLIHTTMHNMRVVPVAVIVIAIAIAITLVTRVGVVYVSSTIATVLTTTTTAANSNSIQTPVAPEPPIQYQHTLLLLPNPPIHPHDDTLIHGYSLASQVE